MFDSHLKSTGRDYSMTIALLAFGLVFIPAVLVTSHSFGRAGFTVALVGGAFCLILGWLNWKANSKLTIPTLEDERKSEE